MILRAGRDEDAQGFIDLIGACWAEYPGCVMDLDGEVPELRALASYYAGQGGALWVHEADGIVAGMVGARPLGEGAWELCKMYVASSLRGGGVAQALAAAAEDFARAQGAGVMKLWSDTRFDRAHRFYEKLGYLRDGPIRVLNDLSNSLEFAYTKPLTGVAVRVLDAAAAASAAPGLAAVLQACVADGFLPPLDRATARAQFQKVAKDVARGQRVLLAAWVDGVLAGTVQMALDMPANQRHRAEIAKLLVLPAMRRRGVARRLMDAAEAAALAAGRSLLVLETPAGDAAEALYRKLGWIEAGRIPGFALDADGTAQAAVIFYRTVG